MRALLKRLDMEELVCIVDKNEASRSLFTKFGFEQGVSVCWFKTVPEAKA
jgi:L-amino acid N-acyltransferase YncA